MFFVSSSHEDEAHELNIQRRSIRDNSDVFSLSDGQFVNYFRLSKHSFRMVLEQIDGRLKRGVRATSIPNVLKLAATLRLLAQGSYQVSVGNDFNLGLAQPTVSLVLSETLDALQNICAQWVKFEMSEEEKSEAKQWFYTKTGFPGVIGCVDGTHFKITAPEQEVQHMYYNRKGYFSINAMVVCDHKMRIRFLDARHAGSSHDSTIWRTSPVRHYMHQQYQSGVRGSWLLGDAGYPLETILMTPYRSAQNGTPESLYNKKHSKTRNIVERTIGLLKSRFRCLLGARQLHYKPEKVTKIANVCAALHNICVHYGTEVLLEETNEDDLNNEPLEELHQNYSVEASAIREEITNTFL